MIIKAQKKIRKNLFEAVKLEDLQDLNRCVENGGIPVIRMNLVKLVVQDELGMFLGQGD